MRDDITGLGAKLGKMIVLPVGDGIWQGLVRTIVKGVLLLSGQAKQQVVVGDLTEAAQRLQEAMGSKAPNVQALRETVGELLDALGETAVRVR